MSLLLNKRKRDESPKEYNNINSDNNPQFNQSKNYFDFLNNNDNILEENNSNNNKNNAYDLFQQMFISINSKKEDINQNNIIMSPLFRSSLFFGSFQKLKNFDKIVSSDKSKIILSNPNSSFLKNKTSPNYKKNLFLSPSSSFKINKNYNYEGFMNNKFDKFPLHLDFGQFNFSDKKNVLDLNSENKINEDNKIDIFGNRLINFFDNIIFNNSNNKNKKENLLSEQKEDNLTDKLQNSNKKDFIGVNPINTSLFMTTNKNNKISKHNSVNKNKKLLIKIKNKTNAKTLSISKPFQTYNPKLIKKNLINKEKSYKPKIFHIEKIFNKKEYKDANEKEENEDDIYTSNRFKISLKKIKQIYKNSCLKIYSYINDKISYEESNLNNELYISEIIKQVCEIIKSKKINSSKMNEILQVNDDDKYRRHYFMFTSEAKQFCLDLINKKNFPFDVVMKMCKVPRKSLRRWLYVGCQRKKGCGRKTKNPEMEMRLVQWYNDIIKKEICVTSKMIREKAVEICDDKDFLASKGWLEKFKRKFNIQIANNKNKGFRRCFSAEKKNNETLKYENEKDEYDSKTIKNKEEKGIKEKDFKFKKFLFVKTLK